MNDRQLWPGCISVCQPMTLLAVQACACNAVACQRELMDLLWRPYWMQGHPGNGWSLVLMLHPARKMQHSREALVRKHRQRSQGSARGGCPQAWPWFGSTLACATPMLRPHRSHRDSAPPRDSSQARSAAKQAREQGCGVHVPSLQELIAQAPCSSERCALPCQIAVRRTHHHHSACLASVK